MTPQERRAVRERRAARQATAIIEQATERIVAARTTAPPSSPQDQALEVKRLRDEEKVAWWVIGQKLGLAKPASTASDPEAKRGAGRARGLYAAANRGVVPRTQAPRKGVVPKPQGPASRAVPDYVRKTQLVTEGHVIPRDLSDAEVEALVLGRRIEWAIDMARLTDTDPETWGKGDGRWVKCEARVHVSPEWVKVEDRSEEGKPRVLHFREYAGFDTDRQKHMSGPHRVVLVDSIYTVA